MDMYIKKNDRCHPLGFPEESIRHGSFISERRKYYVVLLQYVILLLDTYLHITRILLPVRSNNI
jgi:hypothetical protein